MTTYTPPLTLFRLHIDGGANISITNDETILINYKNIRRRAIAGVSEDSPALHATGVGYLPWRNHDGDTVLVRCHFSPQAAETIISPNDIVINEYTVFYAWSQYSNVDDGKGYVAFHCRNSEELVKFDLETINGLWYYHPNDIAFQDYSIRHLQSQDMVPTCRSMSSALLYLLWHARGGHNGETTKKQMPKHIKDFPIIRRHPLFKCNCCMTAKCTHRPMDRMPPKTTVPSTPSPAPAPNDSAPHGESSNVTTWDNEDEDVTPDPRDVSTADLRPGQMFQMDMGFVRGSGYDVKDEDGKRITSLDGYNSYLIIIDQKTRRHWIFLTKNKNPPLDQV